MAERLNSFAETTNRLLDQVNIALEFAQKTSEALTTQQDSVVVSIETTNPVTGDPSIYKYSIPSYNTIIDKLNTASNTVDTFVKGDGLILMKDGTYRSVKADPIPISPARIVGVAPPNSFTPKNNWFFEDLMFPQLVVSFDLKGKIDDRSDRVVVRRVIFDNFDDNETQWFLQNIANEEKSFYDVISILTQYNKKYWLDDQVHDLPLSTEPYTGYFLIKDKRTIDGKEWYYLDTINYGEPSDDPVVKDRGLAKNDQLRYKNSTFKISDINVQERRVQVIGLIGLDKPVKGKSFEIYSPPFSSKILDVPIGYNECDVLFLKGVNDTYNIIADEWSPSISFYTSDLILSESNDTLQKYYEDYVSDFGKQLEGQAKEKFIPAWFGLTPDPPALDEEAIEATQINTQLNSTLDSTEIKNTQIQIESTKTIVQSLKDTIAQQKAELVALSDPAQREDLNNKISVNVEDLAKRTVEYQSLVRNLSTIAYESDAVTSEPKFRLRGFFNVPEGKRISSTARPQEVIGFELAYRYLREDNTGVALKTFDLKDPANRNRIKKGVFSDWNIISTPIKERIYDSSIGQYIWKSPDIANGDEVNINQVDIPIRKGEKVQIKVRSISEAGWPTNPVKSDWSEPIIKEFPANLQTSDQVTNILTDAVSQENTIKLEETLSASGVNTHLSDSIPNPVAGSGTYFKHQAINLAYDLSQKDKTGTITSTSTTDLQTQLSNIGPNSFVTMTRPTGADTQDPQITGTVQKLLQAIVNIDPSIYDEFNTLIG